MTPQHVDMILRSLQFVFAGVGLMFLAWDKPWSYVGGACLIGVLVLGIWRGTV